MGLAERLFENLALYGAYRLLEVEAAIGDGGGSRDGLFGQTSGGIGG